MSADNRAVEEEDWVAPLDRFDLACSRAVNYLSDVVPMGLWGVTRVEFDVSTMLVMRDTAYGLPPGASLPFQDLPCSHMVEGTGPVIAHDAMQVPVYATCGFAQIAPLGAYLSIPVTTGNGGLFGTICGYHPEPKPASLRETRPLLDLVSTLLSAVLVADRSATNNLRRAELSSLNAETDSLTGLSASMESPSLGREASLPTVRRFRRRSDDRPRWVEIGERHLWALERRRLPTTGRGCTALSHVTDGLRCSPWQ